MRTNKSATMVLVLFALVFVASGPKTLRADDEEVDFPDPILNKAIRLALDKEEGEPILQSEFDKIMFLTITGMGWGRSGEGGFDVECERARRDYLSCEVSLVESITDLRGLDESRKLSTLYLYGLGLENADLEPIGKISSLRLLLLEGTVVRFNFLDFTEQPVEGLFAGPWRAISEVVATWGI